MKRREFIAALGGAAALPFAARAQQAKVPVIGVLTLGNPPPQPFVDGLRNGLREAGYSEDRNTVKLELRTAGGVAGRLPELAGELVRLKVDIIVTYQTPPTLAAKQATQEIPIVMVAVGDPVGTGLVASLARPGGNITGATAGAVEVAGKIVELIRELVPGARRFAVLANETDAFTKGYLEENERTARSVGLEMVPVMVRPDGPLEAAFRTMTERRVDAVVVQGSLVRKDAVELATRHRLPSLGSSLSLPRSGGVAAYSADFGAFMRDAAVYVDKILKGAKPADLPVSFPTKFVLAINLKTAQQIGLSIPPTLLARADEVIE